MFTRIGRTSLMFGLGLAFPAAALMHTQLTKSAPSANETVAAAPVQIRLWFSEPVELAFSSITLEKADSTVIAKLVVAATDDRKSIAAPIPGALAPATYIVAWKTAATDGHPAKGQYRFTYKPK